MLKIFGDRIIWGIAILLFICSILLVYSSGGYKSLTNHITHLVMGIGLIYILSRFNFRYFTNLSTILLGLSVCMLIWLMISPDSYRGDVMAGRWLKLGFFSFQPSELAKYSLILFLCRNLFVYKEKLNSFLPFFLYVLLPAILISLLIIQSNLSTVILIIAILFFIIFISGYPLNLFAKYLVFPSTIIIAFFFLFLCLPPIKIVDTALPRLTTWKNRICAQEIDFIPFKWVDDSQYDPTQNYNNNYQINNALGAINRGVLGKGAGKSYYKRLLPDSKSDFIFAILIEEYGFLGGVIVLFLYLLFYQRILILSIKAKEDFSRLLLLGLGTMVLFQALLHMSVSVNLIPVTGQTLPLISKGGSSVWVTSLAFGIILNISHQINNQHLK